mmetsp:Transcript_32103/g.73915  ORF Transcript_32103/g.73915 Transcript_32103/m.73915 type:complete len:407 (-) Transcript_32103:218-1438(-)
MPRSETKSGHSIVTMTELGDDFQDVRRTLHKVLEEESHLLMTQLRGEIAAELRTLHSKELANFGLQLKHMMSEAHASAQTAKSRRSKGPSQGPGPSVEDSGSMLSPSPDKGSDGADASSQATASTASTAAREATIRDLRTGEVACARANVNCMPDKGSVGLLSHELRSPMNGLAGYARTLAETDTKYQKEFKLFANTAQFALENVTNLIDLWSYASKVNGELVFDGNLVEDINDLTLERLNRATNRKGKPLLKSGVGVQMQADGNLALAGDFTALTVLHYHLVSNSVKFTDRGQVIVSWTRQEDGLRLTVRDSGIGISPDSLDHIFDPFEVEDKSEARKHEGIGLGLAVVREIVRLHRAKLFVQSTKGAGSTFEVLFPCDAILDAAEVRRRPAPGLSVRLKGRGGR